MTHIARFAPYSQSPESVAVAPGLGKILINAQNISGDRNRRNPGNPIPVGYSQVHRERAECGPPDDFHPKTRRIASNIAATEQ